MTSGRWMLLVLLTVSSIAGGWSNSTLAVDAGTETTTVISSSASPSWPSGIRFEAELAPDSSDWSVDLMYRVAGNETLNLGSATVSINTSTFTVTYDLDMLLALEPPGVEIEYWWRLTNATTVIDTDPQVVAWTDDRFSWTAYESGPIRLFSYSDDEAFNRELLELSVTTATALSEWYGLDESDPIRIWVYQSTSDFAGSLAPNTEPAIAGAAYPGKHLILAVVPSGRPVEAGRVLPHEISHQILHQATLNPFNRPPLWFDEGLAVHSQTSGTGGYAETIADAHRRDALPRLKSLSRAFPFDGDDVRLAYVQSWSVVEFLRLTYGDDIITEIATAMRSGQSHDAIFLEAIGLDVDGLDDAWRAWLANGDNNLS